MQRSCENPRIGRRLKASTRALRVTALKLLLIETFSALADYFLWDMPEEPQLVSIDRMENQQVWSQYQKTSTCGFRMSIEIR